MEITKYFELSYNKNATYQNIWDAGKVELGGKIIALKTFIL